MAFTTTMLAWSVIDFGGYLGDELNYALEAIIRATDFFLSCSNGVNTIYVGVGDPWKDHICWERPEDMDTPRTTVAIDINHPGSELVMINPKESYPFVRFSDGFICSVLPESPAKSVSYSPGGLMFKKGVANMQHPSALGFLLLAYARTLQANNRVVNCGNHIVATPARLISLVKGQVDYILGQNTLGMSYMMGYGNKYLQQIHHRGSVMASIFEHPNSFVCSGDMFFRSTNPKMNILMGAVVGGPYENDYYNHTRYDSPHAKPTTYINAPLVGILAYFKAFPRI